MDIKILIAYLLAWSSVLLTLFLGSKYIFRKTAQSGNTKAQKINKSLKLPHIIIGFAIIAMTLIHGIFSVDAVLSLNLGTLTWAILVLLALSWIFKKAIGKKWRLIHNILTIAFIVVVIAHIIEVGGINVFNVIRVYFDMKSMGL